MGQRFKVGDRVMFKDDVEQYGEVTKLYVTAADVKVWDSVRGEYLEFHVAYRRLSEDA